ncbi:hypothetical protein PHISCL_05101 [Aspergillus sclerotialis]|uniref:Transcription factor Iwr1 domain-containing protein n=1 Tax=Aspergillus sclerotialis TaxID=2070753 RepID=A0A3A2ZX34_9EURO|nr:hypothetical protein PHISCL_05101 [Aspergillus sclerotialis]
MSLPPEQINIKRRREEEPVDTLYIQSELHQTKRRFTDFVFQRVLAGGDGASSSSRASPSPVSAAQRALRSPRSVSSLNFGTTNGAPRNFGGGVPLVRATSPGAEFREQKRLAAAHKEAEEKLTRALHSSHVRPDSGAGVNADLDVPTGRSSALSSQESHPSSPGSVRRFQISRSSTPISLRKGTGSGVHKRRDSVSGVAVLVEKLRKKPHSRQASMVTDLLTAESAAPVDRARSPLASEEPTRPRKRPVVNQAERRWREERKSDISTAKQRISQMAEAKQVDSDDESERLAQQFEQIALELEGGMDVSPTEPKGIQPPAARIAMPKPPLKYQPRVPNKPRVNAAAGQPGHGEAHIDDIMQTDHAHPAPQDPEHVGDDNEDDYVYDTYIRRPLPPTGQLTNPLMDLESDQDAWFRKNGIDTSRPDVGVIVITEEDEAYWEHFAEDDDEEDQWDSEDADSNAENNPANDYPDEDLSWDDEEDDPTAIYSKYRHHAASDDEQFDIYDSASEGEDRFGYGHSPY